MRPSLLLVGGVAAMWGISCASGQSTTGGTGGGGVDAGGGKTGSGGATTDGGAGGGTAGATGSGGALERGPTASIPGHKFPFPQNRELARCTYPANYNNDHVRAAYAQWKADTVVSDSDGSQRVKRPNEPGLLVDSTVSEGIGYGMIIAVYMDDQPLFDNLWKYEQKHLDGKGLMHWYIDANGNPAGTGAATDADEDMAWALVMADKQWGTSPTLGSYINIAKDLIGKIWSTEVESGTNVLKPGDGWGGTSTTNPSYFAPAYYKVFATVTGNTGWNSVVDKSYQILNASNPTNGLVPAWCTGSGATVGGKVSWYQYDSCRTPFRIALDWCTFGETRAKTYLDKTSTFFSGKGMANLGDGYNMDGSDHFSTLNGSDGAGHINLPGATQSAAFIGPAGVGAMVSSTYSTFMNDVYAGVSSLKMQYGGVYYDDSWMVMSLLMMTGNFLDYTAL